jgi:hypothetical protein
MVALTLERHALLFMQGCQTNQLQLVNQTVKVSESNRLAGCCGKYVSESIAGLDNKEWNQGR